MNPLLAAFFLVVIVVAAADTLRRRRAGTSLGIVPLPSGHPDRALIDSSEVADAFRCGFKVTTPREVATGGPVGRCLVRDGSVELQLAGRTYAVAARTTTSLVVTHRRLLSPKLDFVSPSTSFYVVPDDWPEAEAMLLAHGWLAS